MFSFFKSPQPNKFTQNELTAIRNTFSTLVKRYDDYKINSEHLTELKSNLFYFGEEFDVQLTLKKTYFNLHFYKASCSLEKFLKGKAEDLDRFGSIYKSNLIRFGYPELIINDVVGKEKEINREILSCILLKMHSWDYHIKEKNKEISIPIFYEDENQIMTDKTLKSFKKFSKHYDKVIKI